MRALLLSVIALGAAACINSGTAPAQVIDAPPPPDAYTCDPVGTPGLAGPTAGDDELGDKHRAGQDCMACHLTGVEGAALFTIAGTLYDGPAGNNPVAGATIVVTADGNEIRMVTAVNGNFHYAGTVNSFGATNAMTELGGTWATECPKKRTMQSAPTGGCNASGCHDGVTTSPGRVFLQLTQ